MPSRRTDQAQLELDEESSRRWDWATITVVGLIVRFRNPDPRAFLGTVTTLLTSRKTAMWGLGDCYNISKGLAEEVWQDINESEFPLKRIQNYASVCRAWSYDRRRPEADFYHHAVLASLPVPRQEYWIQRVIDENMSVEQLETLTADERPHANPPTFFDQLGQEAERVKKLYAIAPEGDIANLIQKAANALGDAWKIMKEQEDEEED